jgi:hypothetical protein
MVRIVSYQSFGGDFRIGAGMDKWEFFQDIKGAWRWRRTSADGRATTTSTVSYQTKTGALYDAKTHGYAEPAEKKLEIEETLVNLKAPSGAALAAATVDSEPTLRWSGYNPYDTGTIGDHQEKRPAESGEK